MPNSEPGERLLLDTHVWLWLLNARPELSPAMVERIEAAAAGANVYIQAFSVWEVAMLFSKRRIELGTSLDAWVARSFQLPGLRLAPLDPEIAIESTRLPGILHGDPADRILAATARVRDLILVTRDAALLAYGRGGHARVLAA